MRFFSIEEADGMVPYLQRTFEGIRARSTEIARLSHLLRRRGDRSPPFAPISEDLPEGLRKLRLDRDREMQKIQEAFNTLGQVGVHVKRGDGQVDFLSRRGDRRVLLCWEFGEEAVTHWHDLDEGDADRQPIARPEAFSPHFVN